MFRMAVSETGKVTYGVCILDHNGEFSWNDGSEDTAGIQKDTWVQYTSAFDFAPAATPMKTMYTVRTWISLRLKTHRLKPGGGEPLYVGLGFKNTLQTKRNRGMYHTMLPGAISQVRFYTSKISEAENTAIHSDPTKAGASAGSLKIWLDFENENIETTGAHITEWIAATAAPTALAYDASFTGKASITAAVQTSDDGKTVKEEKTYTLASGQDTIKLNGMTQAKYVRVKTTFVSDLNSTKSSVPVLNEYAPTAGFTKIWNTLTDWQKGSFESAAGHQPGHVYRNYAKDFDNYGKIGEEEDKPSTGGSHSGGSGSSSTTTTIPAPSVSTDRFLDIANHWVKDAINYTAEKNLFSGTSANTFSPNMSMTRSMFVTVLGRLSEAGASDYASANRFEDVKSSDYFSAYVNWAAKNKIVSGMDANHFAPNHLITREQAAVILDKYLTFSKAALTEDNSKANFTDSSISAYAVRAVRKMQTTGVLNGKDGDRFDPKGTTTRAEAAVIVHNICQKLGK